MSGICNSRAEMPLAGDQIEMPGSLTNPQLAGARFLLKPGRKYQDAVDLFSPYDCVKEPYPEARAAGADLIIRTVSATGRKIFIFVNNRLEGNALETIRAMIDQTQTMRLSL